MNTTLFFKILCWPLLVLLVLRLCMTVCLYVFKRCTETERWDFENDIIFTLIGSIFLGGLLYCLE